MHIAIIAAALALFGAAAQASAQSYGLPPGPKLGEMEVKAYQQIPKAKVAVQLTSDTHLSRELRREVMERLAKRGNQVGFSGDLGTSYSEWLGGWSPANYFATTVSGPDGTSTFEWPMIVFYLLQPLYSSGAGVGCTASRSSGPSPLRRAAGRAGFAPPPGGRGTAPA